MPVNGVEAQWARGFLDRMDIQNFDPGATLWSFNIAIENGHL
jgi:hypothetical protein